MTPEELVKAAMEKSGTPSLRQLADQLDVDHTMVSRWAKGERPIQFEDAIMLAEMAGLPPVQTAAELRLQHAKSRKLTALLKRLSKVAALCAVAATLPYNANAKSEDAHNCTNIQLNIIHNVLTIHAEKWFGEPGGIKFSPVHLPCHGNSAESVQALIADALNGPTVLKELANRWGAIDNAANDDGADVGYPICQAFLPGFEPTHIR